MVLRLVVVCTLLYFVRPQFLYVLPFRGFSPRVFVGDIGPQHLELPFVVPWVLFPSAFCSSQSHFSFSSQHQEEEESDFSFDPDESQYVYDGDALAGAAQDEGDVSQYV